MTFKEEFLQELEDCLRGYGAVPVLNHNALARFVDFVRALPEDDLRLRCLTNVDQGSGSFWNNPAVWWELVPRFGVAHCDCGGLLDRMLDEAISDEIDVLEMEIRELPG
ncbi:hypothetical protein [Saccharothrix coeruleofusca]|uniref:Uncharacterized protein n=1 Tax=Saccharothrix coeruleofusca TaxID=33919 RepID=A0A918AI81_9PSEU|nr:hypothetical protein [Saccharothrix coeruleofusca]MBP2334500.1 hypothetical protein [Saccharothrix coeruleofusca]GGP40586.1 hypothetical protein GCM10010185_09560 [Saccharothrix coeruleofusca]